MEREKDINETITPERMSETKRVCGGWNKWVSNKTNKFEQDDSGIGLFSVWRYQKPLFLTSPLMEELQCSMRTLNYCI